MKRAHETRTRSVAGTIGMAAVALALAASGVSGAEYYVWSGGDNTAFTNWATAAHSIQSAVDRATGAGDVVWVTNGTYTGTGTTAVNVTNKAITLRSVNGYAQTIINGQGARRGIYLGLAAGFAGVVQGFTVSNCSSGAGAGIYTYGTVQDCLIINNTGVTQGGGILARGKVSHSIIKGNKVTDSSGRGGGILCYYGSTIENCLIVGNTANGSAGYGGGVSLTSVADVLRNCTVAGNIGRSGGGAGVANYPKAGWPGGGIVQNCVIYGNTGDEDLRNATGGNSIMTVEYSCYGSIDGTPGSGVSNIVANPIFLNTAAGDYRTVYGSPCINAGKTIAAVTNDFARNVRPYGGAYDMGAFEYSNVPTTWYVSRGGNHSSFTSWATAATNIQAALDKAHSAGGDTVLVTNGVHRGTGTDVATIRVPVTLRGLGGVGGAVIDGQGTRRGVYSPSVHGVLDGMIVSNCYAANGGGIYTFGTVQNCLVVNNSCNNGLGGGVLAYSSGKVYNSVIRNNVAGGSSGRGGGICIDYGSTAENCLIVGNTANGSAAYGGGVMLIANSDVLRNCTVAGNIGRAGGGAGVANYPISGWHGMGTVQNCVIYGNTGDEDLRNVTGGTSIMKVEYSCYGTIDGTPGTGTGNVVGNPFFVNAAGADYHLRRHSPCIDTGMTIAAITRDLDGNPRPVQGALALQYDMGAYELPRPFATCILIR